MIINFTIFKKLKHLIFYRRVLSFIYYKLLNALRVFFELINIDILSKPYGMFDNMDHHNKLLKQISNRNGFFVELGGYEGFFHSPTYYLERFRGWNGILIEPQEQMFKKCQKLRTKSVVYNYACVPFEYKYQNVKLQFQGLSSNIIRNSSKSEDNNNEKDNYPFGIKSKDVRAKTITSIIDGYFDRFQIREIDLLVLDVEGFELDVLKGLDFEKYKPINILCESRTVSEKKIIENFLNERGYKLYTNISHQDYLYKREN